MEKEHDDFEEINERQDKPNEEGEPEQFSRIRFPKKSELVGVIIQRFGGNRMDVKTSDGKTRNCRVPGKHKRRLWLRPKDIVLIVPWEFDNNRGDIIYKYSPNAVNRLRKEGFLDNITDEF